MAQKFYLTTIDGERHGWRRYLYLFACAACKSDTFGMIEHAGDGIVLFQSAKNSEPLKWLHFNHYSEAINGASLSISCVSCGHDAAGCHLSSDPDGIFFILESYNVGVLQIMRLFNA